VGVAYHENVLGGQNKIYKVLRLTTPSVSINDNLVYETPFYSEWREADAKDHQILRKRVYKTTPRIECEVFEYANPRIIRNNTKKPGFETVQKCISDWYDLRLIANQGYSLGRVTYNLFGKELRQAIVQCSLAPNPFEAYATGGYRVMTSWRSAPAVSAQVVDLVDFLMGNVEKVRNSLTTRLDLDDFKFQDFLRFSNVDGIKESRLRLMKSKERHYEDQEDNHNERFKLIKFSENMIIELPSTDGNSLSLVASDVLSDLVLRASEDTGGDFYFSEDEEEIDFDPSDLESESDVE